LSHEKQQTSVGQGSAGGTERGERQEMWGIKLFIYISLQLCKMTDARASHIIAEEGTIKAQNTKNTKKLGQLNEAIKCPSDGVVGKIC
jgi:hypothetical protein